MGLPWDFFYGRIIHMGFPWHYLVPMGRAHVTRKGLTWHCHETLMGFPWNFHTITVFPSHVVLEWDFVWDCRGTAMGRPRDFNGVSMRLSRHFRGASMPL